MAIVSAAVRASRPEPADTLADIDASFDFVRFVRAASTMELMRIERDGVPPQLFTFLAEQLRLPLQDVFRITGVARSTGMRKLAAREALRGAPAQAALGITQLLAQAQEMLAHSTSEQAAGFDAARWFGAWIGRAQPALGGRTPAEFMDTATGIDTVRRLLGALESGSYQ